MNQNVMNWRNEKGMPEIEKIIADSYGERYESYYTFECSKCGEFVTLYGVDGK